MKKFDSRFGIISAGKISAFDKEAGTLTVGGEEIRHTASFWNRFSPQRVTITKAPKAKRGETKQPNSHSSELDFKVGYYVLHEGGHDRFVSPADLKEFKPRKAG